VLKPVSIACSSKMKVIIYLIDYDAVSTDEYRLMQNKALHKNKTDLR